MINNNNDILLAKKIKNKVEKDKKEPTGNQNCLLCTWCAELQFRNINVLPILFTAPHTMQQISELYTKAIAFTLWALALEKGDTAKISNIAYMTPFISLVWTSIVLKEKLSIYSIIGLIVIIIGIFIQMKKDKKEV